MHIRASVYTQRMRTCLVAGVLALGLAGCGSTHWGFPYRATIQQGNWITSEQVAKLQTGMSRDQVRFILGTPTLQDVFHAERWDYPFYNQPGYGKDELRKFTVWFENDQLVRWSGDEQPDRQPFQKIDSGKEAIPSGTPDTKTPEAAGPAATDDAAKPAANSDAGGPSGASSSKDKP